ncbi:peptidylprolyl isomerase [Mangrovibacterium marinum]|uniref:peptidylprolyl isomerase n=1 Tax=Mangrovibacterium marinum TaxID=1639118 RepID=A0A2T5BXF6_9BACT|nr:peptidylprolyl isomerase [Mangrovibacterium marinum]PTN04814.1 peptidylprolyl isomerase/peptidyl-prolyl cis-trans isomerase B (cyclophilin B) [Mangrovibacterium marinum]
MKYFLLALSLLVFNAVNAQSQVDHIVEIQTNLGTMRFKLYNDTPKHRDAFMQLAREGYYNETLFYRVIENFLIQGGSRSSRNAPPGKRIGYGDPDHTVDDEIVPGHIHKKGALCAPRQPDEVNPFKQSDISQFYIIEGQVFTEGQLDTMEMAVNRPIRKKVIKEVYTPEIKAQLKQLKAENKVAEFREIAEKVKADIEAKMKLDPKTLVFTDQQRKAYTTVGGYPDLDGKYTIFGECISGFDVIDKISKLKTDTNNRPYTDVMITVKIIQ